MKNNKLKIIFAIIGGIAIFGIIIYFVTSGFSFYKKEPPVRYDSPLTSFRMENRGDINGGFSITEITLSDDGAAADIKVTRRESASSPEQKRSYTAPETLLSEIQTIFYDNAVGNWASAKKPANTVYDDVLTQLTFTFGTEEVYIPSDKIPAENFSVITAINKKIADKEVNENSPMKLDDFEINDSTGISIEPYSLENGYFVAAFLNNTAEKQSIETECKFFISENGEWKELAADEAENPGEVTVEPGSRAAVQYDLNRFGKLAAGRYKIESADASAEFTVIE